MGDAEYQGMMSAAGGFDFAKVLSIADALPMPIALVDGDLRYQFCNRAMADFFEVRRSDMLGRTMSELLGEKAFADRKPMLDAAAAGERQWFAAQYDHPSRGPIALQTEYLPQKDAKGRVTGIVVLVQDVTEQRVAERALRESEARFRRIANSAPVIMWVTRLDRQREFVNEAYLRFAGIDRNQMESHDWKDFIHPDDWERLAAESAAGEASLQPFALEARFRRQDGEWRWLRSVSSPRFGPDGELIGFIGAAFDVTPAKQGELQLKAEVEARAAELSASEARFRAVFDTARELMALLDVEGRVLEVNRTAAAITEQEPDAFVGQFIWDVTPLRDLPESQSTMRELVAGALRGAPGQREVELRAGGRSRFAIASVTPVIGRDGRVEYLVAEAHDVTELRGAQEQLRQSQKMEALGQLTGGIAHDFNNLLTVVVGGLDLVVKRAADPKLERYARNALEAAERGARLTAQLLAFSRVQRLEVKPTLVAPLVEHMQPLLRNVLGPGIEKLLDLDPEPMPVLADPTQVELAVLNLAINARDAMPEGGLLTIRTARVHITADPELEPGDYLELAISDTGIGMSAETLGRAFEPFFTTKEVGRGTGLGLSMVYGVARQSGGTARIESVPGQGTTVRLYFPRASEAAGQGPAATGTSDDQPERASAASVLVVDDDPDVRGFIVASLEDLGYDVREASDGASALVAFRSQQPDLLVLDFLMPGMSGAEVARSIREQRPEQPILFVSGYSETDAIRAAAPEAALLPKPFRADALGKAVRAILATA